MECSFVACFVCSLLHLNPPALFISSRGICGASLRLESLRPAMGLSLSGLSVCSQRLPPPQSSGCERSGGRSGGLLWPGPVSFLSTQPVVEGKTSQRDSRFSLHQSHCFRLAFRSAMLWLCRWFAGSWPLLAAGPSASSKGLGATWPEAPLLTLGTKGALRHSLSPPDSTVLTSGRVLLTPLGL